MVSYHELLQLAWQSGDPTREAPKVQYAALVLAHDDEQLTEALASARRLEAAIGRRVVARIEPLGRFWLAEDYHQKYHWRQFAGEWERRTATQAPDWRSKEFGAWLNGHGVSCGEGLDTPAAHSATSVRDAAYRSPSVRVLEDIATDKRKPRECV